MQKNPQSTQSPATDRIPDIRLDIGTGRPSAIPQAGQNDFIQRQNELVNVKMTIILTFVKT